MDKRIKFFDLFGLETIGIFSLGYICFSVSFAELHIQLSFLDFPIFVGEILLFMCLLAFASKCFILRPKLKKWCWLIIAYVVFVLYKALSGYGIVTKLLYGHTKWGPLAFRDAALLYYPIFILFGYSFYRRDYFDNKRSFFLFLLIILLFAGRLFYGHWALTLFILGFVLIKECSNKVLQYVMSGMLLLATPYKLLFYTARMMLVGNLMAGLYLVTSCSVIAPLKPRTKLLFIILGILFLSLGVIKLSNLPRAKSIIGWSEMIRLFQEYNEKVKQKKDHYQLAKVDGIKIYNPEEEESILHAYEGLTKFLDDGQKITSSNKDAPKALVARVVIPENTSTVVVTEPPPPLNPAKDQNSDKDSEVVIIGQGSLAAAGEGGSLQDVILREKEEPLGQYDIVTGYHNALFRVFIWRDMIAELAQRKPILGFDFGKPLRSISLEILNWGTVDWQRDGWISAHNSYLHMIYRTGVVGILFIFVVFAGLFRMVKKFVQAKSLTGILLCGVLIDWFMAANFLLILELPYTAIPIWTLYGMTWAYCYKKEAHNVLEK